MRNKRIIFILVILFGIMFIFKNEEPIKASNLVSQKTTTNIFGDILGKTMIYDDGKIEIEYKYGLKKVDISYCNKETNCSELANYYYLNVLDSTEEEPHKNSNLDGLELFDYKIKLSKPGEYFVKVDVYFGTNINYDGISSMHISSRQSVDTGNTYIRVSSSNNVDDERINKTLDQIIEVVNTIVIPVIYGLISIVLVIKGALIGTAIVKSADDPQVRQEKIKSLKWLVIGVAIAYASNSVIGVFTGFFKNLF